MKGVARTMTYGKTGIDYELVMMRRKSLEIAVHPDKRVVVKAPLTSTTEAIEQKIRKRARWIKRQITYFGQFDPRTPKRQYVGGESHPYLGRKYRLKIESADKDKVLLKNGYFFIDTTYTQPGYVKNLLEFWYMRRARSVLPGMFDECWEAFGKGDLDKPHLTLRKMDKRWGSLSEKGRLTLNINLIKTPRECIEYVVIHEFCHLIHHNHGREFYKLLDRTMPDWAKRKETLEMALA